MAWECFLFDSLTGLVGEPLDVPSLSWSLTVSGATLETTADTAEHDLGVSDATGLRVPWDAIPGATREARMRAVAPYRRGLCLSYDGVPVVAGLIGDRSDTWADTGFDLVGPMALLESRYLVREGAFGAVEGMTEVDNPDEWDAGKSGGYSEGAEVSHGGHRWGSTCDGNVDEPGTSDKWEDLGAVYVSKRATYTTDSVTLSGLSLRAIACEVVRMCTEAKPGGTLPIDLPYLGEVGAHERTYGGFDASNLAGKRLLDELAGVEGGPDMQLRPYMADASHLRWTLVAGSDSEPLMLGPVPGHSLTWHPDGGTLDGLSVGWGAPVMRVYGTGSGQDQGTICSLAEDLSLVTRPDPWPVIESTMGDSSWDGAQLVAQHAATGLSRPRCQLRGTVSASDRAHSVRPGLAWPGEPVRVIVDGYPSLPDGAYDLRLMEMSGTLGDSVSLTFDVMTDPWEA